MSAEEFTEKIVEEIEEEQPDFNRSILENLFSDEPLDEKDRGLDILFNSEDTRKVTDIDNNNVKDVTVLLTFTDYFKQIGLNCPSMKSFCDHFLNLSLSKDRKSREEIVEIYKTTILGENMSMMGMGYDEPSNFFGRMKERFRGG